MPAHPYLALHRLLPSNIQVYLALRVKEVLLHDRHRHAQQVQTELVLREKVQNSSRVFFVLLDLKVCPALHAMHEYSRQDHLFL